MNCEWCDTTLPAQPFAQAGMLFCDESCAVEHHRYLADRRAERCVVCSGGGVTIEGYDGPVRCGVCGCKRGA